MLVKTEEEIKAEIKKIEKDYDHVLICGPALIQINAPRALMQMAATNRIDALCWVLDIKRPKYKCDDTSKTNM